MHTSPVRYSTQKKPERINDTVFYFRPEEACALLKPVTGCQTANNQN